ncbi:hypothetical protein AB0F93_31735 [Micromonospora tulbaghiae]|uniref:hypothetical protein n=1 Tax=Micromonospora tulbaghiae TaxID=479978 RepID=UPI003404965E
MTVPNVEPDRIPGMRTAAPTVFVATAEGLAVIDTIAVERAINGERKGWSLTNDEARIAADLILKHGLPPTAASVRTGVNWATLCEWFPDVVTPAPEGSARSGGRRRPDRSPVKCGTRRGYDRHKRRKEQVCERCRAAYALAYRYYRTHGTYIGAPELTDTNMAVAA